jgi:hypothetical protein
MFRTFRPILPVFAIFFVSSLPAQAQQATADQCGAQVNSLQGMFDSMKSGSATDNPQAGLAAMASIMSQFSAAMGKQNPGAEAMFGLFQDLVNGMAGLTDCRRTQVNTIKADYNNGVINKDEAKERLADVKKDVQQDNQKIEQVRIEAKTNPKSEIATDSSKAVAVDEAAQEHKAVEKEIDELFSALDA